MKWLGDGVMFYFREPTDAVLAALDMVEGVASHDLPPARVGLHAGPVVFQDGDYFGRTVNLAARIADYARPGEVVVSQEVGRRGRSTRVLRRDRSCRAEGRHRYASAPHGPSPRLNGP